MKVILPILLSFSATVFSADLYGPITHCSNEEGSSVETFYVGIDRIVSGYGRKVIGEEIDISNQRIEFRYDCVVQPLGEAEIYFPEHSESRVCRQYLNHGCYQ